MFGDDRDRSTSGNTDGVDYLAVLQLNIHYISLIYTLPTPIAAGRKARFYLRI